MTKLLERAVEKVKALPDNDQDAIAALILEELEDEVHWDESFARTQDKLAKLAADAMAEYQAGRQESLIRTSCEAPHCSRIPRSVFRVA